MPDRWDAEAREALCCCDGSRERSHALYCPADNSALVACVVALARRAYREGLERAVVIGEDVIECCECLESDHHRVSDAIRREIEGLGEKEVTNG